VADGRGWIRMSREPGLIWATVEDHADGFVVCGLVGLEESASIYYSLRPKITVAVGIRATNLT
jgi:hypothetical protein